MNRQSLQRLATALAASALLAGGAHAATIVKDFSSPSSIPGLTGFSTTGAMMTGLSITANFAQGSQTLLWAPTGATSGGVSAATWGLSLTGDSFATSWLFTTNNGLGELLSLVIDGSNALTVLDTTLPSPGTDDSASGTDFAITAGPPGLNAASTATYTNAVGIGAANPVGDLFQTVTVVFAGGVRGDFSFVQDTDNDSRFTTVPEPGTLALVGLALAGAGYLRRKA